MIKHAGQTMIPVTTQLTSEKYAIACMVRDRKRQELRKRIGIERALWLMEQIEHIEELISHQTPIPIRLPKNYPHTL